jgi:Protein of unknown function (DUF1203)
MKSNFRVVALTAAQFEPLFSLSDEKLVQKGARRLIVDANPGFPCRVSLEDAEIGERVILAPFTHHDVDSPYRASGPIFVRENAKESRFAVNEVPEVVASRTMSARAYDKNSMMIDAAVVSGSEIAAHIERLFDNVNIEYVHLHNAGAGCYCCKVERVAAAAR